MVKALIFDLDGTLWNSVQSFVDSCNKVFQRHLPQKKTTYEEIASYMGFQTRELAQSLFPNVSEEQSIFFLKQCYKQHLLDLDQKLPPFYEGVREGIEELSRLYPVFLVSNCNSSYLKHFLKHSGLGKFFSDSECAENGNSKGKNIRLVMERNHIQSAVYIGDTSGDAKAAEEASVDFIFVTYGCGNVPQAKKRFDSFPDLVAHFKKELPATNLD